MIVQFSDGMIYACNAAAEKLLGLTAEEIQENIFRNNLWRIIQGYGSVVSDETHPAILALQTGKACADVAIEFCQPTGQWIRFRLSAEPLFSKHQSQDNQPAPSAVVTTFTPMAAPTDRPTDPATDSITDPATDPENRANPINPENPENSAEQWGQTANSAIDQPVLQSLGKSPSERLFATLESISDGFFSLDQNWRFTYVNSQAARILHRSPEELIGKNHWEEFSEGLGTIAEQEYCRAVTEQVTVSFEIFYPPMGRWFTVRAYPITSDSITFDSMTSDPMTSDSITSDSITSEGGSGSGSGLAVYFQDVTEQKLAAAAFLQQEQTAQQRLAEIEAIYATAPIGLCFNDTDLRYVRINQQLAEINGATVEQHLGRTLRDLLPELADQIEPIYRQVIETGEPILNLEISGVNAAQSGALRDWLSSYYPLKGNDDRVLGVNVVVQELTERKRQEAERQQSEAALRQSEERYRTLFESIDEGFCVIEVLFDEQSQPIDYRFIETNPTFEQQTGLQDAIGKTARQLVPDLEDRWFEIYGNVVLTGKPTRFEDYSEPMNRWFDVYALRVEQPENHKVAILFKDITDRVRDKAALQESEARFRRMTDLLPQIMWTADPDGTIDYYNQHWEDYTGASRVGTADWEWRHILHPDDQQGTINTWAQSLRAERSLHEHEHRIRRKDGAYRWHLTRAVPYRNTQGQIVKWFGLAIDIHEQKLAMEERERYAEQSNQLLQQEQVARAAAERANRVKDEFLAILSHELRSPLNPILGWSKLLQSGRLSSKKTREALEAIERNAKLQTQLIDDLLDISRIMRGKLSLTTQPTELTSVISAAAETVRLAADAKRIQIDLQLDPTVGQVYGDSGRLQQVLWNLLSNAVKFTPGGGRVEVKLEALEAGEQRSSGEQGQGDLEIGRMANSPAPSPGFAQITITDTGKGISPEFMPYLFDYFRQEDGSITRKFGGLGLGLAIARQILEMHGGTISAQSAGENQGATFTVRLPLLQRMAARDRRGGDSTNPAIPSAPQPLAGIRVLVVDDDEDTRELLNFLLDMSGAIVTTTHSGTEALKMIEQSQPDVLLSDIGMPEMDGYTLMRSIRETIPNRRLAAIALTAYAGEYDRQQAFQAGFQRYIPKPIDPDTVTQSILDLLSS